MRYSWTSSRSIGIVLWLVLCVGVDFLEIDPFSRRERKGIMSMYNTHNLIPSTWIYDEESRADLTRDPFSTLGLYNSKPGSDVPKGEESLVRNVLVHQKLNLLEMFHISHWYEYTRNFYRALSSALR